MDMPSPDTRPAVGPSELGSFLPQTQEAVLKALGKTFGTVREASAKTRLTKFLVPIAMGATALLPTACSPIAPQPVPPAAETGAATPISTPIATTEPARPTPSPQEQAKEAYASLVFSSLDRLIKKAKDEQKEALRSHLNAAQVKAFFVLDQKQGGLRPEVYQLDDSLVNFALISYPDGGLGFLATNIASDGKTVEGATLIDLKRTLGKVPLLGVDFLSGQPAMVLSQTKNGKGESIVLPALLNANQQFQTLTEVNGENAAGYEVGGKIVWEEAKQVASLNILSVNNTPTPLPSPTRPAPPLSQEKENIYYPLVKTVDNAPVYTGPGSLGYDNPTTLGKDNQIKVTGLFGDFYKVEYVDKDGKTQEGWVYGKTLDAKTLALNQDFTASFTAEQVPWQTVKNLNRSVDNSKGNGWYGSDGTAMNLKGDGPFGITVNVSGSGDFPSLSLSGRINSDPNKPWWQDVSRLYVAIQNRRLVLQFRNGASETSVVNVKVSEVSSGQTFSLVFSDSQGKKLSVLDNNGKTIKEVDVTQMGFRNGLFPDKKLYPGVLISPKASLTVNQLSLTAPPTGRFGEAPAEAKFTYEFPPLPPSGIPYWLAPDKVGNPGDYKIFPVERPTYNGGLSTMGKIVNVNVNQEGLLQIKLLVNVNTGETKNLVLDVAPQKNLGIFVVQYGKDFPADPRGTFYQVISLSDADEAKEAINFYFNFLREKVGEKNMYIDLNYNFQDKKGDGWGNAARIIFSYPGF